MFYYEDPSSMSQRARFHINHDLYILQGLHPVRLYSRPSMVSPDFAVYETIPKSGHDFDVFLRGERVRIATRDAVARTRAQGIPYVGWSAETARPRFPFLRTRRYCHYLLRMFLFTQ